MVWAPGSCAKDLLGLATGDVRQATDEYGAMAERFGHQISDYIVDGGLPHGVFVIARHDERQAQMFGNCKLGEGPYYALVKNHCLVHVEAFRTIERILTGHQPLLNNALLPRVGVAAIAKRALRPGEVIERGCGSFDLRGVCVNIDERSGHVPICLASRMRVRRAIEPGAILSMDDVELPESEALDAWQAIEHRVLSANKEVCAGRGRNEGH